MCFFFLEGQFCSVLFLSRTKLGDFVLKKKAWINKTKKTDMLGLVSIERKKKSKEVKKVWKTKIFWQI